MCSASENFMSHFTEPPDLLHLLQVSPFSSWLSVTSCSFRRRRTRITGTALAATMTTGCPAVTAQSLMTTPSSWCDDTWPSPRLLGRLTQAGQSPSNGEGISGLSMKSRRLRNEGHWFPERLADVLPTLSCAERASNVVSCHWATFRAQPMWRPELLAPSTLPQTAYFTASRRLVQLRSFETGARLPSRMQFLPLARLRYCSL